MNDELAQLKGRLEDLADGKQSLPGAADLAAGLAQIADHLEANDDIDAERLEVILQGMSALADLLDPTAGAADKAAEEAPNRRGLEQFVATFQKESSKRLQGLAISLMAIFGNPNSEEALEQSADHLHAIRGGAAMLGIEDVAELAAEMENTLLTGRKVAGDKRQWPTKTLLRGFAILEEALADDPPQIQAHDAPDVIADLRNAAQSFATGFDGEKGEDRDVSRETPPAATPEPPPPQTHLEQPILVVDDVETIAASVAFILAELEVPIEVASNGEEAMQKLLDRPFSLVISDVAMPRMDGIALTRMIRSSDSLSQMPVILLTSLDHPEERQAGLDAGATDYIIKGAIGGGELVRRVRELLEVAPVVERAEKASRRRILVAEDAETVAASIGFVLAEGPYEIVLCCNGREALQKLRNRSFDLLITDMQMPYMDGTQLVEALRADDELSDLPVILLTSVDDPQIIDEAQDAGIDQYLQKGEVAGGKLLSIVDDLLH